MSELTTFLRARAHEDIASRDDVRIARGRAILGLVGIEGDPPYPPSRSTTAS